MTNIEKIKEAFSRMNVDVVYRGSVKSVSLDLDKTITISYNVYLSPHNSNNITINDCYYLGGPYKNQAINKLNCYFYYSRMPIQDLRVDENMNYFELSIICNKLSRTLCGKNVVICKRQYKDLDRYYTQVVYM